MVLRLHNYSCLCIKLRKYCLDDKYSFELNKNKKTWYFVAAIEIFHRRHTVRYGFYHTALTKV